jgi:hypothetical protein
MFTPLLYIVGFFRIILFLFAFYFISKWLGKLFSTSARSTSATTNNKTKEGETTIKFNKKGEKIINKDKGEYVDFEEID